MTSLPQHIPARTVHHRKGEKPRTFSYHVDFVLLDLESPSTPWLLSRNRFNILSVWDKDHGGTRGAGVGLSWAQDVFDARGISYSHVLLLTQPRFLGLGFNPVSFWLALQGDTLVGAISEVNNTFGDRHCYVSTKGGDGIQPTDRLEAEKLMHVSPFQPIEGKYIFTFNMLGEKIAINVDLEIPGAGFFANLKGNRLPLTNRSIAKMLLTRPFGSLRTIVLIYWQALKLKFRGETYRVRPTPPKEEIS